MNQLPEHPPQFAPDWHHQLGQKLGSFPRYIPITSRPEHNLWPDLGTFVDDERGYEMAYYPNEGMDVWFNIRFDRADQEWTYTLYEGLDAIWASKSKDGRCEFGPNTPLPGASAMAGRRWVAYNMDVYEARHGRLP